MGENLHNLIKVKSLIFLAMRQQATMQWATAGMIATATESSPDSLYVLLGRWNRWGLVSRISEVQPFGYYITPIGHRYLKTLGKWYPGNVPEITLTVAVAANMVIWWGDKVSGFYPRGDQPYKQLYYIRAPFQTAADFIKCDMQGKTAGGLASGESLIFVQCDDVIEAGRAVARYGMTTGQDMLQAFVDAGVAKWKQPAKA
jgi:hypothetical protein